MTDKARGGSSHGRSRHAAKAGETASTTDSGPLIFIDTSSWLPFYEELGNEHGLSILQKIEASTDRLILTEQVLMEFLKHRQRKLVLLRRRLKDVVKGDVHPPPAILQPDSE